MSNPGEKKKKTFPLIIVPSTKGCVTQEIVKRLGNIHQLMEQKGMNVLGYAFDGDKQYFGFINLLDSQIQSIEQTNMSRALSASILVNDSAIYEDVLHLLMTIQYLFVKKYSMVGKYMPRKQREAIHESKNWEVFDYAM
jgi:hypothetical protein